MSWQVRPLVLLSFLIFGATACNDDGKIGPELDPQDRDYGVNFITLTPPALSTILVDSFRSTATDRLLTGHYENMEVGEVSVTAFAELMLRNPPLTFGIPAYGFDSMVLHLKVDYVYGDTTDKVQLSVHRMTQNIDRNEDYFQDASFTYDPAALGSAEIDPAGLTGKTVKVTLDTAEARQIFYLKSGQAELSSQESFRDYFKGLAFVADGSPEAVVGFALGSSAQTGSFLRLHYRTVSDTLFSDFLLVNDAQIGRVNSFDVNRAGTQLSTLNVSYAELPSSSTGGRSYVQSGTGLRTSFNLPDLSNLHPDGLIVNRARLVITPDQPQQLQPPAEMYLYLIDPKTGRIAVREGFSATVQANTADVNGLLSPARVRYSTSEGKYTVDVTDYVQARLLGTVPEVRLLLSPTLNAESVNLLKLDPSDGIKLELYYTELD